MVTRKGPVFTGDNFQVLEASNEGSRWKVRAKFKEGLEKNLEVVGTSTTVLQVLQALSEDPEMLPHLGECPRFTVENSSVLGKGFIRAVQEIHPFHKKVFEGNIQSI